MPSIKSATGSIPRPRPREISNHTIRISDDIAFRISSDTRPRRWKTADLQKGLRLVRNGNEMVGEGTGFGVPVLQYLNDIYFSGESRLLLSRKGKTQVVQKEFLMNRAPRRKIGNSRIQSRTLIAFWRYLGELYMKHRRWRFIIRMSISRRIGVRTRFVEVTPAGKVILTYGVSNNHIDVKADLSLVEKKGLQNVFLLNEQGSSFFRRYSDSDGTKLLDNQIGAWEVVEAAQATMTDINGNLGFRLSQITGGIMRRGREYIKGFQDWAGLDYAVIPNGNDAFEYEIETVRG